MSFQAMGHHPGHSAHEVLAHNDKNTGKGWQYNPGVSVVAGPFIPVALQESTVPSVESLLICSRESVRFLSASREGPLLPPLNANGRQPAGKNKVIVLTSRMAKHSILSERDLFGNLPSDRV